VVDDESVIVVTLTAILSYSGFRVTGFHSAEDALRGAEAGCPDLLITDVAMPGMNGIELAIRFKSLYPSCKILLFSGYLDTAELLSAASLDGHKFPILAKPACPTDLLDAIRKL